MTPPDPGPTELLASLDEARERFLESVDTVRPRLHRFCARMCGSALDGEDVVQEALAQAFFSLPSLTDPGRLEAWLFRIAHRKCIDLLRRDRRYREDTVPYEDEPEREEAEGAAPDEPVGDSLAALVGELPPKERAAVLLKDVLQYRLAEVAEVVDSSVGGVKAALHRGRAKLRALQSAPSQAELDQRQRQLLEAYVACFNRRDWDALRDLIRDDARLEVVGALEGRLREAGPRYFGKFASLPWEWRLSAARVDGEPMAVLWKRVGEGWSPRSAIRLRWQGERVALIRDYFHADYLLDAARIEELGA